MTRSLSSLLCQERLGNLHSKKKRLTTNQSSSFVDWWLHDLVLCCHFFYLVNINGFLAGRHMHLDVGFMVRAAKILTRSIYHPAAQSWPLELPTNFVLRWSLNYWHCKQKIFLHPHGFSDSDWQSLLWHWHPIRTILAPRTISGFTVTHH